MRALSMCIHVSKYSSGKCMSKFAATTRGSISPLRDPIIVEAVLLETLRNLASVAVLALALLASAVVLAVDVRPAEFRGSQ